MNADEALRPIGGGGQARDRDRGCIGADDGFGLQRRTQRTKDLALDVLLLSRRLDHQVAVAQFVEGLGPGDAFDRGVALLLADTLAADLPRQIAVDGGEPLGDAFSGDVVEENVEARKRTDVGNAVAHLAGADHADLPDGMRTVIRPRGTRHWPLPN